MSELILGPTSERGWMARVADGVDELLVIFKNVFATTDRVDSDLQLVRLLLNTNLLLL